MAPVQKGCAMSLNHFTATLLASLKSVVRDCPGLRDIKVEVLSKHPYACARLHTSKKKVLVYIDQNSNQQHVVPRLVRENAALMKKKRSQSTFTHRVFQHEWRFSGCLDTKSDRDRSQFCRVVQKLGELYITQSW